MGIKNIIISMTVIGIIVSVMIIFIYNFQVANDATTTILDDADTANLNNDIENNLSRFSSDAIEVQDIYGNTTLKEGSDSLIVPSQNKIQTKGLESPNRILKRAADYVYNKIFGSAFSTIAYSVITLLLLIIVISFIKFIRTGED